MEAYTEEIYLYLEIKYVQRQVSLAVRIILQLDDDSWFSEH